MTPNAPFGSRIKRGQAPRFVARALGKQLLRRKKTPLWQSTASEIGIERTQKPGSLLTASYQRQVVAYRRDHSGPARLTREARGGFGRELGCHGNREQ